MLAKGRHNSYQHQSQCKLPGSNHLEGSFIKRHQWEMLVTARLWKRRKETVPTGSLETREGRKKPREINY